MTVFVGRRETCKTGRILAKCLGVKFYFRKNPREPQVRWGNSDDENGIHVVLNKPEAVRNATNKIKAFRMLQEAGVRVPKWELAPFESEFGILGRSRNHMAGRDIVKYDPIPIRAAQGNHDFFTEYIPSLREFRVHVFGGEVIRVQQKKFYGEGEPPWLRSHDNGYVFVGRRMDNVNPNRMQAAKDAVEALGLDFAAVDVLVAQDGRPVVLECNTAPGTSPLTAKAYLERFSDALALPLSENTEEILEECGEDR
jgi:carbamoylphosphate synthase large subunit